MFLLALTQLAIAEIRTFTDNGPPIAQPADNKLAAHLSTEPAYKDIVDHLGHLMPPVIL